MPAKGDLRKFKNADLVLSIDPNVSPLVWNEGKYEAFIEELCGIREFQKEAIRAALRYWLGGKYSNLKALAKENFDSKDELLQRYGSWGGMEKQLQFPEQLACSLDLATGTGKSFVLYGLAAILLAEGIVESVLVLCPSNTIEAGLTEKFRELAGNANLRALLPAEAKISVPRIINASQTIVPGSICVENYHAILAHVKSSIRDSLKGRGARVAVFNDEAHHITSESTANVKRWKEFLLSSEYGFRILLGVSGTCYVGDDYFSDVIFRYSLRKAIEEHFVKKIEYVAEAPQTDSPDEKWQLVYNRHQSWKKKLKPRNIRPLTIVVTRDIDLCKRTASDLAVFLEEWEKIPAAKAAEKVLVVTSDPKHQANIALLKQVDGPSSKVEWIVSVAMLNEGWDVKNVFQIVPHEEKAFNSKLLIGQVLGRGLRRPEPWIGEDPTVTVFNHDAWSGRIRHLVNEVLEIERRITSSMLTASSFNFELHTLDYSRSEKADELTGKGDDSPLKRGFVELPTQVETEEVVIDFTQATNNEIIKFKTQLTHKTYSIDEVAETMFRRLESIDEESKEEKDPKERTNYAKQFPIDKCVEIVKTSLKRASIKSSRITEDNRQKFLAELGTLRKKRAKKVLFALKPKNLLKLNTKDRRSDSCSAAELRRRDKSIFYGASCTADLPEEQVELLKEIQDPDGDFSGAGELVPNGYDFKTPANLVIADATPERKFVRKLCERDNAQAIDAWLKNTNQGFYFIEYAWRKNTLPKRGEFSPDFFIKVGKTILVVEIKEEEEITAPHPETCEKSKYAVAHFQRLNKLMVEEKILVKYQVNFLTPNDYNKFFQLLRENKIDGFRSELDVALKNEITAAEKIMPKRKSRKVA